MFAAQVFPLCDKSGLNLTCEFNEDNVTGLCRVWVPDFRSWLERRVPKLVAS